jgi:hypothetical protein
MKIEPVLAGVAGEYFVAGELSRRGLIASVSLRNTRGIDIIVTNRDASKSVTIQCKTNQLGTKSWILNKKSETFTSPTHFYVFVILGDTQTRPEYHIVPSRHVAKHISESHKNWLSTPGKKGQEHKDTNMRRFSDFDDKYLEAWELLKI